MATFKIGSSGSGVEELQRMLNQNGANLTVDGQYGSQTENAVRAYQQANGLSVDGIAGNQTLGKLGIAGSSASGGSTGGARTTAQMLAAYETGANAYTPNYQTQINDLLSQIQNRQPFQYDFASDPVYQNYAERYMHMGRQAMKDAMAQSMQNSGGFANTWAQTVGQQQYDEYLTRLGEIVPELQRNAYDIYQNEGDQLRQNLAMYQNLDATDYDRWLDQRNYWYNKYSDEQQAALARAAAAAAANANASAPRTINDMNPRVPTSVSPSASAPSAAKLGQRILETLTKEANSGATRAALGVKLATELKNSGLSAANQALVKQWINDSILDGLYLSARKQNTSGGARRANAGSTQLLTRTMMTK